MGSTNSRPRNEASMRDEVVVKFKESQEILDKLFKWLLGVISFKATDVGKDVFAQHPNVMMAMVLMIVVYFLVWLVGTLLRHRVDQCSMMILVWFILVIGSIALVLLLTIISSLIAWTTGLLWVGIFAVTAYCYYYEELNKLFVCPVSAAVKKLIESYRRQGTRLPV